LAARSAPLGFLKKRSEYLALREGARVSAPAFLLVRRPRNGGGEPRVGVTVSKKLGKAVARNRMRRRLKEAARATFPEHAQVACDYLLIARATARTQRFSELLDDMRRALQSLARKPL
jgi:ribonuclease P protein component